MTTPRMMTTVATPEAVNFVLDNLWDRGQCELNVLGISMDVARGYVTRWRDELRLPTMAIWFEGEPVVITGLTRTDHPFGMNTWFQATEMFSHYARPITQEIRSSLVSAANAYSLEFVEIVSPCVHPDTGRWFRALGFELDVDRYITVREGSPDRLYRFVRRFKKADAHVLPEG